MKIFTKKIFFRICVVLIFLIFGNIFAAAGQTHRGYNLKNQDREENGQFSILVYYDMEGLSGQTDWKTTLFKYSENYRQGQQLLAADVNALVDGLFAGGADEVHLVDFHSSGNLEPDLPSNLFNSGARQVLRDEPFEVTTGLKKAVMTQSRPLGCTRNRIVAASSRTPMFPVRQFERAAETYQTVYNLDPNNPANLSNLGFVYVLMGRHAEAIRVTTQAVDQAPNQLWLLTVLGYSYARGGKAAEVETILHMLEALPEPDPYLQAIIFAGLEERDKVFPLLKQAVAEKNAFRAGLGVDPVFDAYRSDPRMDRLLEKLALPSEKR